jgi:hypothetical protein
LTDKKNHILIAKSPKILVQLTRCKTGFTKEILTERTYFASKMTISLTNQSVLANFCVKMINFPFGKHNLKFLVKNSGQQLHSKAGMKNSHKR